MDTTIALSVAVTMFISVGIFLFLKNKKEIKRKLDALNKNRVFSADKKLYNGTVLSDYKGTKGGYADDGWIKGWVSSPQTCVVAAHSNPAPNQIVHTYNSKGEKIVRTIDNVIKIKNSDIAIVKVASPWEKNVKIWEMVGAPFDKFEVQLKDGGWSIRTVDKNSLPTSQLHAVSHFDKVPRLLIQGESGLPWRVGPNHICGHTWRGDHGIGPNYLYFAAQIKEVVASMENGG